jgi:hypothetical protein
MRLISFFINGAFPVKCEHCLTYIAPNEPRFAIKQINNKGLYYHSTNECLIASGGNDNIYYKKWINNKSIKNNKIVGSKEHFFDMYNFMIKSHTNGIKPIDIDLFINDYNDYFNADIKKSDIKINTNKEIENAWQIKKETIQQYLNDISNCKEGRNNVLFKLSCRILTLAKLEKADIFEIKNRIVEAGMKTGLNYQEVKNTIDSAERKIGENI